MKKIIESKYLILFINLIVLIYSMSFSTHLIIFLYNSFQGYYIGEAFIIHILSFYAQLIFTLGVFLELRTIVLSQMSLKNKSDLLNSLINKSVDITNMKLSLIGLILTIILYAVSVIGIFYVVWILYLISTILSFLVINILFDNVYINIKKIFTKV